MSHFQVEWDGVGIVHPDPSFWGGTEISTLLQSLQVAVCYLLEKSNTFNIFSCKTLVQSKGLWEKVEFGCCYLIGIGYEKAWGEESTAL